MPGHRPPALHRHRAMARLRPAVHPSPAQPRQMVALALRMLHDPFACESEPQRSPARAHRRDLPCRAAAAIALVLRASPNSVEASDRSCVMCRISLTQFPVELIPGVPFWRTSVSFVMRDAAETQTWRWTPPGLASSISRLPDQDPIAHSSPRRSQSGEIPVSCKDHRGVRP